MIHYLTWHKVRVVMLDQVKHCMVMAQLQVVQDLSYLLLWRMQTEEMLKQRLQQVQLL